MAFCCSNASAAALSCALPVLAASLASSSGGTKSCAAVQRGGQGVWGEQHIQVDTRGANPMLLTSYKPHWKQAHTSPPPACGAPSARRPCTPQPPCACRTQSRSGWPTRGARAAAPLPAPPRSAALMAVWEACRVWDERGYPHTALAHPGGSRQAKRGAAAHPSSLSTPTQLLSLAPVAPVRTEEAFTLAVCS